MRLRNDSGTPVDPVPFLVAALTGLLLLYSFAPGYLLTVGFTLSASLAATTVAAGCVVAVAYHQLVWRARPGHRELVPIGVRFRRLYYAVLAAIVVLLALLVVSLQL